MVEHRGIDESLWFADRKPRASTPRAGASLRSDRNSPRGCFALSGFDPQNRYRKNKRRQKVGFDFYGGA